MSIFHLRIGTTGDPDQLGNSVISANGGSVTISNVSCGGASIKVIAEDQEGCFTYQVVTCSESATWTITNEHHSRLW